MNLSSHYFHLSRHLYITSLTPAFEHSRALEMAVYIQMLPKDRHSGADGKDNFPLHFASVKGLHLWVSDIQEHRGRQNGHLIGNPLFSMTLYTALETQILVFYVKDPANSLWLQYLF